LQAAAKTLANLILEHPSLIIQRCDEEIQIMKSVETSHNVQCDVCLSYQLPNYLVANVLQFKLYLTHYIVHATRHVLPKS